MERLTQICSAQYIWGWTQANFCSWAGQTPLVTVTRFVLPHECYSECPSKVWEYLGIRWYTMYMSVADEILWLFAFHIHTRRCWFAWTEVFQSRPSFRRDAPHCGTSRTALHWKAISGRLRGFLCCLVEISCQGSLSEVTATFPHHPSPPYKKLCSCSTWSTLQRLRPWQRISFWWPWLGVKKFLTHNISKPHSASGVLAVFLSSEVNGGDAPLTLDQQRRIGKLPGLQAREIKTEIWTANFLQLSNWDRHVRPTKQGLICLLALGSLIWNCKISGAKFAELSLEACFAMNLHKAEDETCLQLAQSDADLSAMISIAIRYNSLWFL